MIVLFRIGLNNIFGYLEGKVQDLQNINNFNQKNMVSIEIIEEKNIKQTLIQNENNKTFEILDVRDPIKWQTTGIIKNSLLNSLGSVKSNLQEIITKSKGTKIGIICRSGIRATIAASIFIRNNFYNVFVLGGYLQMNEEGVNFTKYP